MADDVLAVACQFMTPLKCYNKQDRLKYIGPGLAAGSERPANSADDAAVSANILIADHCNGSRGSVACDTS